MIIFGKYVKKTYQTRKQLSSKRECLFPLLAVQDKFQPVLQSCASRISCVLLETTKARPILNCSLVHSLVQEIHSSDKCNRSRWANSELFIVHMDFCALGAAVFFFRSCRTVLIFVSKSSSEELNWIDEIFKQTVFWDRFFFTVFLLNSSSR